MGATVRPGITTIKARWPMRDAPARSRPPWRSLDRWAGDIWAEHLQLQNLPTPDGELLLSVGKPEQTSVIIRVTGLSSIFLLLPPSLFFTLFLVFLASPSAPVSPPATRTISPLICSLSSRVSDTRWFNVENEPVEPPEKPLLAVCCICCRNLHYACPRDRYLAHWTISCCCDCCRP
ncbi:hypothetical protein B0J18DRAFT_245517 [Chaetomium sp. MPI-SDFR-AT-0129]|nr:hypothetical protein B0J18DRAFT_245517 [Chaetomium sp. MPI-SDFR-AT-0129]